MNGLDRSDLWFALILVIFLALAAFVFLRQPVADPDFWTMALSIVGCSTVISLVRVPIKKLAQFIKAICWLFIGFAAAVLIGLGGGHQFEFGAALIAGLALAFIFFISDRYLPSDDGGNA